MQDLWRLSAAEMAALIRSRKVSAKEAATAGLARLDAVNPKINAVVDHRPEDVLAQAAAVDAAIGRGEDAGPLGGVPVTVKVNIDQEGFATTNGLKLQREAIAKTNSPVIDNLRKAGAVILGRTNCPAFSYRWFTSNLVHGDTKNPRDPGLTPGGSSGGAGAAVATGIGHIAHGTDIAGSIRYPAYACGVHGLRPTVGRVAAFNAALPERPIGPQISAVSGPLARTIGDLRIALAAMSGKDFRDPWWVPAPLVGPAMPKRVAMCLNPDGLDPVPEVRAAVADAGHGHARLAAQFEGERRTGRMQVLGADRHAPGKIVRRSGEIIAAFVAAPVHQHFARFDAAHELRAVLAIAGREYVVVLHRAADADVRRFVTEAGRVRAEFAGALQRDRLGVETAHQQHLLEQLDQVFPVLREFRQILAHQSAVGAEILQIFDFKRRNRRHSLSPPRQAR